MILIDMVLKHHHEISPPRINSTQVTSVVSESYRNPLIKLLIIPPP